jgi:branched-chain amino acid transport system ATP-binding protein
LARPDASSDRAAADENGRVDDVLVVRGLGAGYGNRQVVFDVDVRVGTGEVVLVLGHNGAGKTTLLKSVFGLLRPIGGAVHYRGKDVTRESCAVRVRQGMAFIPAERGVFGDLSVLENLKLGAIGSTSSELGRRLDWVCELFPALAERRNQLSGTMSGGQQRMLSLGIALMSEPKLMLVDEPSLGLSPTLVQQVMDKIRELAETVGLSVLMLEQNVVQGLRVADRVYVIRSGRLLLEETAEQMRARGQWWDLF